MPALRMPRRCAAMRSPHMIYKACPFLYSYAMHRNLTYTLQQNTSDIEVGIFVHK